MQVPRSQKELARMRKPLSHSNSDASCKKKAQVSNLGKAKRKSATKTNAVGVQGAETVHHPIFSPMIDALPDPPFSAGFKDGLNRFVNDIGKAFGALFPNANDTSQRISRRR